MWLLIAVVISSVAVAVIYLLYTWPLPEGFLAVEQGGEKPAADDPIKQRQKDLLLVSDAILVRLSVTARAVLSAPVSDDINYRLSGLFLQGDEPERLTLERVRVATGVAGAILAIKSLIRSGLPRGQKSRPILFDERQDLVVTSNQKVPFRYITARLNEKMGVSEEDGVSKEVLRALISLLREKEVYVPGLRSVKSLWAR